ncbi:hypothetical protein OE88DRAFT_793048 [Heliocybe sulcata]|uniref:Tetraspannin-domain-containing protein n=1 Tax=Heliocybe sulcata TaxID=5364 RepID=A0A5C3MR42_9AGAM|nr:hypothetical protein OE88DRAFT_793048 [Heliocybe sulcata]
MVQARTFCCCLPVRFGVICMSMFWVLAGGAVGAVGIHQLIQLKQHHLDTQDMVSLAIPTVLYTALAVASIFGFFGAIVRNRSWVSAYGTLLYAHLGFSIVSGAFALYNLFHSTGLNDVRSCISDVDNKDEGSDRKVTEEVCQKTFDVIRVVLVIVLVILWLIELYGCIIVSNYVGQLDDEETSDWVHKTTTEAASQATARAVTTYNVEPYMFTRPHNASNSEEGDNWNQRS